MAAPRLAATADDGAPPASGDGLPQVVDQLTPQGKIPEGGLGDIGALLGQLTSR